MHLSLTLFHEKYKSPPRWHRRGATDGDLDGREKIDEGEPLGARVVPAAWGGASGMSRTCRLNLKTMRAIMAKKATRAKAKTATAEEIEAAAKGAEKLTAAPKKEEPKTVLDQPIPKPTGSSLDRFKAKRSMAAAGPSPLESLSVMKIAQTKDWTTLHPDEENYWSEPMCFVDLNAGAIIPH